MQVWPVVTLSALLLLCTCRGAIPADVRVLPDRIILVRHAQSEGNVDCDAYTYIPDPQVPLVSGQSKQVAACAWHC
jgi:hypothetical protein